MEIFISTTNKIGEEPRISWGGKRRFLDLCRGIQLRFSPEFQISTLFLE